MGRLFFYIGPGAYGLDLFKICVLRQIRNHVRPPVSMLKAHGQTKVHATYRFIRRRIQERIHGIRLMEGIKFEIQCRSVMKSWIESNGCWSFY